MSQDALFDPSPNVSEFFREVVTGAVRSRGSDASDASVLYVVTVLEEYARPHPSRRRVWQESFTLQLRDAMAADGPRRFELLRRLGDEVLYVSGFFADHLTRRGVELGFVSQVGSRAYGAAHSILARATRERGGHAVFEELADRFDEFVSVLGEVSDALQANSARTPREMLEVYERWMRTGSDGLAQALAGWGMVPQKGDGTLH